MASVAVLSSMNADAQKSIHPLFRRQNGIARGRARHGKYLLNRLGLDNGDSIIKDNAQFSSDGTTKTKTEEPENDNVKPKRGNSKRKQKGEQEQGRGKIQRTLSGGISLPKSAIVVQADSADAVPRAARSKRRKTGDCAAAEVGAADEATTDTADLKRRQSPQVIVPRSSPLPGDSRNSQGTPEPTLKPSTPPPRQAPKKELRIRANGTFSSPPTKIPKDATETETEAPKRRGRPRKSAASRSESSLVAVMKYGKDDSSRAGLGARISRILVGDETVPSPVMESPKNRTRNATKETTPKKPTPKKRTPQKVAKLHPLFQRGKKEEPAASRLDSPRKVAASTPGKLRMQAMADREHDIARDIQPFSSALLRDRHMIKHPGAQEPPFPSRGLTHVRGLDVAEMEAVRSVAPVDTSLNQRKRKRAALSLPAAQSIMTTYAATLEPERDRARRPDGFFEPKEGLKLPKRMLISGVDVANRIIHEVSVPLHHPDAAIDELALPSSPDGAHPALQRLFERIPSHMTAFDESKGEAASWPQKHAPSSSIDVLQPVAEMDILKEWLSSLAVQAVGGAAPAAKAPSSKHTEKPKKKRRKKADDMDDFLVDSDEDVHEMSELADSAPASPTTAKSLKSVVHIANEGQRMNNVVVLSGPHGCGKTAAAYAVAKELGFKVFEISSSERRSGKDVLDKIGDMTENHLMKHHGTETGEADKVQEPSHIEDAFQKDLESGRQGKMSSFFKPKGNAPARPKAAAEANKLLKDKTLKAVQEALKRPPKDQQQSLILLEEVDILFKDDKEFWATILKLVQSSKRPFILTCNDEGQVPLQALEMHAILRFQPPPVKLATDYMLLLAAAEGHLLKRAAIASLYEHHQRDLRASITELDYWCQMGVGDPREGLSWIYQRWPPGSDTDCTGRKVRVISEDTYQQGMGLVPDFDADAEDALWWAWNNFDVEPHVALGWKACHIAENEPSHLQALDSPRYRLKELRKAVKIADSLSESDACTAVGLPDSAPLDMTLPEMKHKARGNYIEGMALLQTDERADYTQLSKDLLIALSLATYNVHEGRQPQVGRILARIPAKKAEAANAALIRSDFACFDAICVPAEPSAFDGPLTTITEDLAPYVRSIVQYDQAFEEQRERLNLLSSDGRQVKRARTTRAARSAVEGSQRSTTRKEKWFAADLNLSAVLATGGRDWPKYAIAAPSVGEASIGASTNEAPASSAEAA